MKTRYNAFLLIASLFVTINVFGWGPTPHAVIAYLGYEYITDTGKSEILPLLQSEPSYPSGIICFVNSDVANPDNFWASAVSSWPDSIKYIKSPTGSWGNADPTAQAFCANGHFINIPFPLETVASMDTQTALDYCDSFIVNNDGATEDDLYYLLRSCIKSLIMSRDSNMQISRDEQIFALRHLIHLVGDNTQPIHMSSPIYTDGTSLYSTFGGNTVDFELPYNISNYGQSLTITELHALWDNPGKLFTPFIDFTTMDTEIYIDKVSANAITNISGILEEKYSYQIPDIIYNTNYNTSDLLMSWITETYILALENVCNNLGPVTSLPTPVPGRPDWTTITINTPTAEYVNDIQPVVELQIYRSAVRLGALLNAIYDPDNAPSNFVEYVNSIRDDNSIPTVNELCGMNYQP